MEIMKKAFWRDKHDETKDQGEDEEEKTKD